MNGKPIIIFRCHEILVAKCSFRCFSLVPLTFAAFLLSMFQAFLRFLCYSHQIQHELYNLHVKVKYLIFSFWCMFSRDKNRTQVLFISMFLLFSWNDCGSVIYFLLMNRFQTCHSQTFTTVNLCKLCISLNKIVWGDCMHKNVQYYSFPALGKYICALILKTRSNRKCPGQLSQLVSHKAEWAMVGEEARGRPLSSCVSAWAASADREDPTCLWTRFTCSDPSSWSLCCASSWLCVWTWWLCWVQRGSPPTISPCLCGSPAPSPRLASPRRRLSGAVSPRSHLVGADVSLFLGCFNYWGVFFNLGLVLLSKHPITMEVSILNCCCTKCKRKWSHCFSFS